MDYEHDTSTGSTNIYLVPEESGDIADLPAISPSCSEPVFSPNPLQLDLLPLDSTGVPLVQVDSAGVPVLPKTTSKTIHSTAPIAFQRKVSYGYNDSLLPNTPFEDKYQLILYALKENVLFVDMVENREVVKHIVDHAKKLLIPKGQRLIKQGEVDDCFYIVEKGLFDVLVRFPDGVERNVAQRGPPNIRSFGELALLRVYQSVRNATCKATTNCVVWKVERLDFQAAQEKMTFEERESFKANLKHQREKGHYSNAESKKSQAAKRSTTRELRASKQSLLNRRSLRAKNNKLVSSNLFLQEEEGSSSELRENTTHANTVPPSMPSRWLYGCMRKHPILFSLYSICVLVCQITMVLVDTITDFIVLERFYRDGFVIFFTLTVVFISIPSVSCWAMSFQILEKYTDKSKWFHNFLLAFYAFPCTGIPLHFFLDLFESCHNLIKMLRKIVQGRIFLQSHDSTEREAFVRFRSLITAFGESLPQAALMLVFMFTQTDSVWVEIPISFAISLINLAIHMRFIYRGAVYHGYNFSTYFIRVMCISEISVPKHPPRLGAIKQNMVQAINWANFTFEGQSSNALLKAIIKEEHEKCGLRHIVLSARSLRSVPGSAQGTLLKALIDNHLKVTLTECGTTKQVQNYFKKVDRGHRGLIDEQEFLQLSGELCRNALQKEHFEGKWFEYLEEQVKYKLLDDFQYLKTLSHPHSTILLMDLEEVMLQNTGCVDLNFGKMNMISFVLEVYVTMSLNLEVDVERSKLFKKQSFIYDAEILMDHLIELCARDPVPSFLDGANVVGETALSAFVHYLKIALDALRDEGELQKLGRFTLAEKVVPTLLRWLKSFVRKLQESSQEKPRVIHNDSLIIYRLLALQNHPKELVQVCRWLGEGLRFENCCYTEFGLEFARKSTGELWEGLLLELICDCAVFDHVDGEGENVLTDVLRGENSCARPELIMASMSTVTGNFADGSLDGLLQEHVVRALATNIDCISFDDYIVKLVKNLDFVEVEDMKTLCPDVDQLRHVRALSLVNKDLSRLPDTISNLEHLRKLIVMGNGLELIPGDLPAKLEELNASHNRLAALPSGLGELQQLRFLDVSNNALQELPDEISLLRKLKCLSASGNQLLALPGASFRPLARLRELFLNDNDLEALPDTIGDLKALRDLNISGNKIQELPRSIANLKKLQILNAHRNYIKTLPDTFGELVELRELNLSKNQIDGFPDSFGNLRELQKLTMIDNQTFTSLPETFGKLEKLKNLNLYNNKLTSLPNSMSALRSLRVLDVRNNQIEKLPDSLCGMRLHEFSADGNPVMGSMRDLSEPLRTYLQRHHFGGGHIPAEQDFDSPIGSPSDDTAD